MIAAERLFLTADRSRIVLEGDPDGAFLYAAPGDEVPDDAVEQFGLTSFMAGAEPAAEIAAEAEQAAKEYKAGSDKEDKAGKTKGAGQ